MGTRPEDYEERLLDWDEVAVDDPPLITVQFSMLWLSYIVAALERLKNAVYWKPSLPHDVIEGQICALQNLLMTDVSDQLGCPVSGEIYLPYHVLHNTIVVTTVTLSALAYAGGYIYQTTPLDDGDVVMFRAALSPGPYKLLVHYLKASIYGKMVPVFDGIVTSELETIDTYQSVTTFNNFYTWDFEVVEGGECDVYLRVNGKNVASTNYYLVIQSINLKPVWD